MDIVSQYPIVKAERPTKAKRPNVDWIDGIPVDQLKAAYLYDEQQRIVDAVFKVAATEGWCSEVLDALNKVFPNGSPWSDGKWRDTEGYDCRGLDFDGYGRTGFNLQGRDRQGNPGPSTWCDECRRYHR